MLIIEYYTQIILVGSLFFWKVTSDILYKYWDNFMINLLHAKVSSL